MAGTVVPSLATFGRAARFGDSLDPVFAKCAWRLVPLLALLYFLFFLDYVNVGFAALTMNRDLALSASVYGVGAGIFFLAGSVFAIPATLLLHRVGARRSIFCMLAIWGLASAGCAAIQGPTSFYTLRLLLGIAEAGFFPGAILYLSLWFPQAWRGKAIAGFIAGGPIGNILAGPVSVLLLGMNHVFGMRGWQWMFLLEGLPAFALSFAALRLLPDSPRDAAWLTADEKHAIQQRLIADPPAAHQDFWPALRDPRVLALAGTYFGLELSIYGFLLWLPQILQQMGLSDIETGFIVSGTWIAALFPQILCARSSDAAGERIWHFIIPITISAAGWVAAAHLRTSVIAALLALLLVRCGINATFGPFWGLATDYLRWTAAAGAIPLIFALGRSGGFAGPAIMGVLKQATGGYSAGMLVLAAGLVLSAAIVLTIGRNISAHQVTESAPAA